MGGGIFKELNKDMLSIFTDSLHPIRQTLM